MQLYLCVYSVYLYMNKNENKNKKKRTEGKILEPFWPFVQYIGFQFKISSVLLLFHFTSTDS